MEVGPARGIPQEPAQAATRTTAAISQEEASIPDPGTIQIPPEEEVPLSRLLEDPATKTISVSGNFEDPQEDFPPKKSGAKDPGPKHPSPSDGVGLNRTKTQVD